MFLARLPWILLAAGLLPAFPAAGLTERLIRGRERAGSGRRAGHDRGPELTPVCHAAHGRADIAAEPASAATARDRGARIRTWAGSRNSHFATVVCARVDIGRHEVGSSKPTASRGFFTSRHEPALRALTRTPCRVAMPRVRRVRTKASGRGRSRRVKPLCRGQTPRWDGRLTIERSARARAQVRGAT
jgi:hypothetical protein